MTANIVFFIETTDNSVTALSQISRALVSPSSFTRMKLEFLPMKLEFLTYETRVSYL